MRVSTPHHRLARLELEAGEMGSVSVARALDIDYASSGDRLGRVMQDAMDADMSPFLRLRAATREQLDCLGRIPAEKYGLFMLAADMATAAEVVADLDDADRKELQQLWQHLHKCG